MRSLLRRILRPSQAGGFKSRPRGRVEIDADRPLIYAIGDVHGCFHTLRTLEAKILADARENAVDNPLIVYLGDYIDRGPDSKAVIAHLARRDHDDGIERIALCGNHDDAFLRFIRNPVENAAWLDFGGDATLRSYGLGHLAHLRRPPDLKRLRQALAAAVPKEHVSFLENLPVLARSGNRIFVHAGIRPAVPLEQQADEDLLWIREPFLSEGPDLPIIVIHGHTAAVKPVFAPGRVCIDTGCYATGRLTALKVTPRAAKLFSA